MTDAERIAQIQKSRTPRELNRALSGFREHVTAVYPALALNDSFKCALDRNQYFHALGDVKRAARGVPGGGYQDVIRVLERATDKQFSFPDK